MPKHLERAVFLISGGALLAAVAFGAGLYSAVSRNAIYQTASDLAGSVALVVRERENLVADGDPVDFLQPARHPGDGVTLNAVGEDGQLVLISGFFGDTNETRLLQRDGTILARWPVRFSEHFPDPTHLRAPPQTDRNVDLHGVVLLPDGSLVFNYEYSGTVKLDRCGETVWTLPHATHHSVETSMVGGFWIPGRDYIPVNDRDRYPPFTQTRGSFPIADDLILKVSSRGEIVDQRSVTQILYDNGLEGVMTATGNPFQANTVWDRELTHLNKIGELPAEIADAFPEFETGDLLLSLRQYNLVLVVDPVTWTVRWHQTGPWLRQHDPEFNPDGTITVFNNNAYKLELGPRGRVRLDAPKDSNIIRVDPVSGRMEVSYGEEPDEVFSTVVRGKHEVTPDGGFLITESEAGRIFEVDAAGMLVWEYVNRFDDEQVLELTEARLYPESYFDIDDWSCR